MKNNKKKPSKYFILAMVTFLVAVLSGIVGIILFKYALIFLVVGIALILLGAGLLIGDRYVLKDQREVEDQDKENIIESINSYKNNRKILAKVVSKDEKLENLATSFNDIIINDVVLEHSTLYEDSDFFMMVRKYVIKAGIEKFSYIRFYGISERTLEPVVDKYPYCYIGKGEGYYDLVVEIFDKKELEQFISTYVHKYKNVDAVIAYYDEFSLDEIEQNLLNLNKGNRERVTILDRNSDKEVFNNVINKYKTIDLSKDNLIEDYLIDIFPYIPFTHMAVLIDDEYLRLVNYQGALQIDEIADIDFKTWLKLDGVKYLDKQIHIVYANENLEISITPSLLYKLNKINAVLNNLAIIEMDKQKIEDTESRFNNLEEIHESLSYEVDEEFIVTHASKKLNERFDNKLLGSYCYETLYERDEPCKNCPLKMENTKSYLLSSNLYQRIIEKKGKKTAIYLLSDKKPYVKDRSELNNVLLGLLNTNAKGYLLAVKLDSLPQLAAKNKISSDEIVNAIIKTLDVYGLTQNLYRKEEDEFVYILENASVSEASKIAKDISKAFLESFEVGSKEYSFVPKTVLLSFPLEVNTLFSLDSLCRTLFLKVTKKGMLYRIDEAPLPIDDHRFYMELVEESYKAGVIPFTYTKVKDSIEKESYVYASLNYMDENQNPIPEDQITLYAKIDNTYLTLADKVVRGLDYESSNTFLVPLGKEGLNKRLFESLAGFFSSKKVGLNRVIFEAREKDIHAHLDEVNAAKEMGFRFAVNVIENYNYNLDLSTFEYVRINGRRLESDKGYQNKVNLVINQGVETLIEDKYKGLITNVRFTF